MTLVDVTAFYANAGYDFICITDKIAPFTGNSDDKHPLLVLSGMEVEEEDDRGSFYHVVCVEGVEGITMDTNIAGVIQKVRAQGGITIWAHPYTLHNTVEEGLRYNFHGVEVFNSINQLVFGKGMASYHWDAVLTQKPDMLGFATDDAHFLQGVPAENGGWIMVNAPEITRDAIMASIHKGNFYSSTGPIFKSIFLADENRIVAETSPVISARLVGPRGTIKFRIADEKESITDIHFRMSENWPYARLEIEDTSGHKAWSNPLFISKA